MKASSSHHIVVGDVPTRLPGLVRDLDHHLESVVPGTSTDYILKPGSLAITMMHLMRRYAVANHNVESGIANAWFDEQVSLAREGRFIFFHHPVCGNRTQVSMSLSN